jgi:hypothetical protein
LRSGQEALAQTRERERQRREQEEQIRRENETKTRNAVRPGTRVPAFGTRQRKYISHPGDAATCSRLTVMPCSGSTSAAHSATRRTLVS